MTREELLAWAGLVVGIPGFALLFVSGYAVEGGLAVVVFVGLFWLRWSSSRPEFTIIQLKKSLTFHDATGRKATLFRDQIVRANHKGLTEFWIKGISADGPIENILVDDKEPTHKRKQAGAVEVCKHFRQPLQRGETDGMTLSYDMIDAFLNNPESMGHTVGYKTKLLVIVVRFHNERPCRSVKAFLRYGGQIYKSLPQPIISNDSCKIEIAVKRPRLGSQIYLEWDW